MMRAKLLVVVLVIACCTVVWHLGATYFFSPEVEDLPPTGFIYLVQTESCIPDHLKSPSAIGNASACQCDVLVLSYKNVCHETPPAHVEYIFNSSTTWNSGRNLLYETARQRNKKYLYYTFMDDDIDLLRKTKRNPWRIYEDFLTRVEPVIGSVDFNERVRLNGVLEGRKQQGCDLKKLPEYLPIVMPDSAFNSFHYQAIDYLLPYPVKFDKVSWWFNGWFVKAKAEAMFPGQVLIHTELSALNNAHRPYPRYSGDQKMWDTIIDDVKASLPEEYRNVQILREWREQQRLHGQKSSTLCLPPPPPHMPIRPFAYLEKAKSSSSSLSQ